MTNTLKIMAIVMFFFSGILYAATSGSQGNDAGSFRPGETYAGDSALVVFALLFPEKTPILSGKVFNDQNNDGWPDQGERGIANVKVTSDTHQEALTDKSGYFTFKNLEHGERIIKVEKSSIPQHSKFSTAIERKITVQEGLTNRIFFGINLNSERVKK